MRNPFLAISIYVAGQTGRKPLTAGLLVLAVVAFLFNEMALRRLHPEYNIRIDLLDSWLGESRLLDDPSTCRVGSHKGA
jgi:hypothetical protein